MKLALLLLALFTAGCGRYRDFRLPEPQGTPSASQTFHWTSHARPVLSRGAPGEWDAVDALNPAVVEAGDRYYNFYSGFDGKTWHTGLSVSADGITWTRGEKVLSPSGWEGSYIAANGAAVYMNREFLYWYQAGVPPRIGLARSRDGKNWRKSPGPVLEPGPRGSWDERGVADPYVMLADGRFYMYYLGQDRGRRQRLGVAVSEDGVAWWKLRRNPILELGEPGAFDENGLGEPAVWSQKGYYWMLYTGRDLRENRRMGLARSRDGVGWQRLAGVLIEGAEAWNSRVVCDASVAPAGAEVRVWFGGGDVARPDERLNGQIGYGVLRIQ